MSAERGGAAPCNGAQRHGLRRRDRVRAPVRVAVGTHDVGHLVARGRSPPAAVAADDGPCMTYSGVTGASANWSSGETRSLKRCGVTCR